ncbi:hypothetical protein [Methylorubrum sp. SB2]|uniref:hypothetical protein n=1 Tax=Methylorubrum subtropicum TaxID=3138812 RepID=UPI00313C8937
MNAASLNRRLSALEAAASPVGVQPAGLDPFDRLLILLMAHYLGQLGEGESIAEAQARALGFQGPRDMRAALEARSSVPDLWAERYDDAVLRLLNLRRVSPSDEWSKICAALGSLYDGEPHRIHAHPFAESLGSSA